MLPNRANLASDRPENEIFHTNFAARVFLEWSQYFSRSYFGKSIRFFTILVISCCCQKNNPNILTWNSRKAQSEVKSTSESIVLHLSGMFPTILPLPGSKYAARGPILEFSGFRRLGIWSHMVLYGAYMELIYHKLPIHRPSGHYVIFTPWTKAPNFV